MNKLEEAYHAYILKRFGAEGKAGMPAFWKDFWMEAGKWLLEEARKLDAEWTRHRDAAVHVFFDDLKKLVGEP